MREAMTTALDVLGLLLVAAGLAAFLWVWMGAASLAPAGFLILAASQFSEWQLNRVRTTMPRRAVDQ